jgi:hypothetical protein
MDFNFQVLYRPETLKLVQERIGDTLEVISIGKAFLNTAQKAKHLREIIDKRDYTKVKVSYKTK